MGKKIIRLGEWRAVVKIKDDERTRDLMKSQVLFWSEGRRRLEKAGGDVTIAFLRQLGEELVPLSMDLGVEGIRAHFRDLDGWGDLDGRCGVTLVSVDVWGFDPDDIVVE